MERKLELLKRSYLLEYRTLTTPFRPLFYEGKGEEYFGECMGPFVQGIEKVKRHYEETIPFREIVTEMDAEDWDDFALLFRVREILPLWINAWEAYFQFGRKNNYAVPKDSPADLDVSEAENMLAEAEYSKEGKSLLDIILKYEPSFHPGYPD